MTARRKARMPLSPGTIFFFNHTATTEIYTLSLHDALPIFDDDRGEIGNLRSRGLDGFAPQQIARETDRKSTRLNSSHPSNSYAVFCLKKKKVSTLHPDKLFEVPHVSTSGPRSTVE